MSIMLEDLTFLVQFLFILTWSLITISTYLIAGKLKEISKNQKKLENKIKRSKKE